MELEIERKISKVGNSLGMTLPAEIAKIAEVEVGETVYLTVNSITKEITIRKNPQKEESFKEMVRDIVESYLRERNL
ncbi:MULTISPECIES: AbrB/MazE/SpoVT family DNA-binding domain-containing protein [Bacillati]|uniref:AbrB/MazE/SpoVT family DNA-binding domain-containing protein n=1 Tax=Bacillati TaxID=1783272 RepID=UPI00232EEA00|nr:MULTISPECIES: AbrB/MazE/SpoVT family DNA-binding domain-containing protein [Terrabacteria group]MDC0706476.1 AbrB/MazE/SpoVT family DNA-binding domain-containing protein [Priestia sp. AB]MDX5578372.1 AbrB/MazE/SpoVT family DNA-binding domain-containing protein [Streptomyces sp. ID01-9D]MED4207632.1 AbrB/MazE/SpoVT family DNA-binding domain-containing protein [Priestia megaterium]